MTSPKLPVGTLLFLSPCWIAGLAPLTGCATKPPLETAALILPVSETLRGPCRRPIRPQAPSVGELAGFSVEQEAALSACEGRKDAAVQVIDAHNAAAVELERRLAYRRPWWRVWP